MFKERNMDGSAGADGPRNEAPALDRKKVKPLFRTLEPRMVFDAAAGVALQQMPAPASHDPAGDLAHHSTGQPIPNHVADAGKVSPIASIEKPVTNDVAVQTSTAVGKTGVEHPDVGASAEALRQNDTFSDVSQEDTRDAVDKAGIGPYGDVGSATGQVTEPVSRTPANESLSTPLQKGAVYLDLAHHHQGGEDAGAPIHTESRTNEQHATPAGDSVAATHGVNERNAHTGPGGDVHSVSVATSSGTSTHYNPVFEPHSPDKAHGRLTDRDSRHTDPYEIGITDVTFDMRSNDIYFVWDNVRDWEQITAELPDDARVYVLDSTRDGVEQIAAILGNENGISAIHLISHGSEGTLNLGSATLDANSMQDHYRDNLLTIGEALSENADILIYGCDFAAGEDGLQAALILSGITRADIAASIDPTGAASRGGNWTLERQIGAIEASAFTQVDYQFLLAAPSVDLDGTSGLNENSTVDYTENSPAVSIVANGPLGATVSDSDNDLQTLTITADNAPDGDDEHLSFNGVSIAMGSDSSNAVTVGATTYRIVYTAETRTFVITNDSGENIPSGGDTNTLVRSITYDNSSDDPTEAGAATSRVFSFIATDETGASSTPRTATVNITAVNDAPVNTLPASGWSTDEDAPVQLTGLQVSDPDVGTGSITVTLSVTSGSIDATDDSGVAVGGTPTERTLTGSLADINAYLASESAPTYTPAPDFNGDVTLTMTTSDNGNSGGTPLTDTDNSVITIDAINDAPVGVDDIVTIAEDGVASGNVLTNDTDADGDPLTVTQFVVDGTTYSAGEPATISGVGTLVINADGSYSFSPEENYDGSVPVVTYTVSDGGLESTATLSVSIDPVNDAPVDGDETNVVAEDTTLTVASGSEDSLLANTTDVDSTDFTVSAFSVDGQSGPFVIGAAYAIAGVGDITINADGSYTFTPAQNYTGAVPAITYTVSDASGGTDTSTLSLTIVPSNDAPAGTDNTVTITEDTAYTFSVASFGFTDPDDTPANSFQAVIITTLPPVAEGTLYLNGVAVTEGQVIPAAELANLTFEPAADVNGNGIGAFTFQVVDDGGTANNGQDTDQSPNTFAFNITNVNDVPVGVDDEATTPEDTPLDVPASSGLLSNDLDADGDTLTITQFSVLNVTAAAGQTGTIPGVGDLTINADGSYTFVPVENYVGPVPEITYTVVDGNGGTTTATLTLEVTPVNDPPVDGNETNTVTEDTALTVDEGEAGALLNNASDLDGDTLTITEFTVAGEAGPFVVGTGYLIAGVGTVTINANGSYSFVPVADYDGPIPVITYTVSDGAGGTDTSTLTLNMQPVNDAPIAQDDAATTPENTPVSGNILDNDTDVDNPTLTVTFFEIDGTTYGAGTTASIPGVGSLVINADGTYTFTPLPGYDGPVPTATYTVSDGDLTDTAELTLVITPLNDQPVADNDTGTIAEDTTLTVPADSGLLAGDTDIDGDALTVTEFEIDGTIYSPGDTATIAGVGNLTINADGSYTFVPAPDYNGSVPVVTYTVSDGNGGTDQGTLTLEATPVNDPPVATDDDGTTPEDTTLSGDVLANDTDIEGDDLTLVGFQVAGISGTFAAGSTATISGIGTVTINADGTYTLIPAANYTGPVPQITYIISDGNGGTDTATLDLVVTPVNDPPVANDDDASTPQDTPLNGNVIDNDTDVDGDTVVVTEFEINGTTYQPGETATIPGVGDITINADGSYNFDPAPGYNGPVPDVDYTISDGNGGTDDGTLHIDVIPPGGVGANNDVATTPEDTTLTGNVVSNDIDPNDPSGNSISVTEFTVGGDTYAAGDTATIPGIGALTINADGTYTFVPAANYFGPVPVVTYTATNGTASDTATLTITVTPVNDPPVAADDVAITPEDTPLNGNLLANDTDIESDGLIVTQFSIGGVNFNAGQTAPIPGVGQLTVNPDGTYTFVPFLDYNGPVPEVTYTVSDGNGGTDTATLNIEVTPVNDAPVAEDDNATTPEDTTLTVAAPGLLANDTDVDGDALSVSSFVVVGVPGIFTPGSTVTIAGIGDLTINADGSYTFGPAENYNGSVPTVIYSVTDGTLTSTARLNIEVTPVNDAPVASDDIATVPEDTTLTVSAGTGLLSNDTDVEEGTLTVTEFEIGGIVFGAGTTASIPGVGALTVNSDGSYTFTPVANYNGSVPQVTYTVTDGDGGTDTALLTITVTPVNDPPVASDDTDTTVEDTEINGNVLPNDTDIDGDSLAVADFTIAGDATVYSAGETATIAGVGSLTINADGTYTFSPAQDYAGPVPVITYTATDNNGGTDTATLTITVSPVNDAPVGVNETVTVDEDTTLTVPASSGVLSNDIDVDGDTLRVDGFSVEGVPGAFLAGATATLPGVGSLTINADGSYTFVPVANYNGPGPVATYRISDGVLTDTAVLTIIVAPVNDPPVDGDETNTVTEDTTLTVPAASGLLANTTDIDGGAPGVIDFTVAGEAGPFTIGSGYVIAGVGTITVNGDGSYSFVPAPDYTGAIPVITYTVSDGAGGTDTSTLTLTMVPVNDPPVDGDETNTVTEDTTLTVPAASGLLANTTDVDGGAPGVIDFTVAGEAGPFTIGSGYVIAGVGTITVNGDGSYSFVPAPDYTGAIPVITYTVSDGAGGTDTSTLTLTMVPVNDPPVDGDETNTVTEDTTLTVPAASGLLANTTDVDGGAPGVIDFTVAGEAGPFTIGSGYVIAGVGTITVNGDGSYSFVPAPDYTGAIPVITYTVSDGAGGTDTSTLTLTMVPVNDPPVASNDVGVTPEDTPLTGNVLTNDTDIDGGALSVSQFVVVGDAGIYTSGQTAMIPGVGAITINGDGSYIFSPDLNYNGPVPTITYTVSDGAGGVDTANLLLTVIPVNDPPVDGDETNTVTEDTTLTVPAASGLLANTTDVDGGAPGVIDFTVAGEAGPFTIGSGYVIAGVGTITVNGDGSYSFVPAPDYTGAIPVITYTVSDGAGGTDTSTLTLTMVPVNDPPVDGDETNTVTEDTTLTVPAASGLLANTTDVDGGAPGVIDFTVAGEAGPFTIGSGYVIAGVGTITVNGDGSYSFVPAPDYTGAIPVITYTVSDGAGGTDTSTLTLTMVPVNDPPVASNDVGVTPEDTPLTGNVLTNDTDIDGGLLRVAQFTIDGRTFNPGESATIAGTGTLTINLNGSYTFVPAPNYNGPVPVATYTVSDGRGGTDTASLIIIVSPVNDPPQSEDIPDQISVDATSVAPVDVSRYFLDVDGDVLTYSASGLPDGLSIDPVTGIISGVLPNDASRESPYTITITATDPGGLSTTETFHWTVVNPAPVASDDAASGPEDANITGTVIANDRDPDGDDLRITAFEIGGISYTVGQTAVLSGIGTLVINADGRYTFTPALNFNGAVPIITYTLSDADGGTDTARLTLNVTPVNDPPILIDDYANGNEDTTITGNVLSNDSDPDGDTLVVTGFSVDGNPTVYQPGDTATIAGVGSITIELNGEFTFVPVSNYDGDVPNILYTAADGNGGTGYARLVITINPVDDYVPVPDDNIPDLPSGPDIDYDPENVDGAVVEAVRGLDGLNDIADLDDQPIDATVKAQFDAPLKFSFNTFLGGSSAIVVDRPGGGVERIQFEVIKHRDVIYLQIVDQTKINEQSSDLNYRIGGVDGALPPAWLKQIGPHTFAGVPDAQTGAVNLMILIIHKDEQVAEREIQLDSVNGLLVLPTEPEDHGFEGDLAPTFAQQMLDGPETQDLSELERALGFR